MEDYDTQRDELCTYINAKLQQYKALGTLNPNRWIYAFTNAEAFDSVFREEVRRYLNGAPLSAEETKKLRLNSAYSSGLCESIKEFNERYLSIVQQYARDGLVLLYRASPEACVEFELKNGKPGLATVYHDGLEKNLSLQRLEGVLDGQPARNTTTRMLKKQQETITQ